MPERRRALDITILRGPALLLEALDAVRIFYHELPLSLYTRPGAPGIPPDAVQQIIRDACAPLNLSDPSFRYYFQPWSLPEDPRWPGCLASYLINVWPSLTDCDVDRTAQAVVRYFRQLQQTGYSIAAVNGQNCNISPCPGNRGKTPAQIFQSVPLLDGLKRELAVVFSDFETHFERVVQLLRPVAERLDVLLAPWVQELDPLLNRGLPDRSRKRLLENAPVASDMEILVRMRFIEENFSTLAVMLDRPVCHVRMAPHTFSDQRAAPVAQQDAILAALRLLGDSTRLDMVKLMLEEPRYCNELAELLGINSGIIYRNLSSLSNCGVLIRKFIDGKPQYIANRVFLSNVFSSVMDYLSIPGK